MVDHTHKKHKKGAKDVEKDTPWLFDSKVFDNYWTGDADNDWCVWIMLKDEGIASARVVNADSTLEEAQKFLDKYKEKLDDEYAEYVESAYNNQRGILGSPSILFITKKKRPCYQIYYRIIFRNEGEREALRKLVESDIGWVRCYLGDRIAGELGMPVDTLFIEHGDVGNFYAWQDRFKMIEQISKLKNENEELKDVKEIIEKLGFYPLVDYYPIPITMDYSMEEDIKNCLPDENDSDNTDE